MANIIFNFVVCYSTPMGQISAVSSLVQKCRYESNLDTQVDILFQINKILPSVMKLKLPSFFTDDYVSRALDIIEEKLVPRSGNASF
jgi:hypothetical protein